MRTTRRHITPQNHGYASKGEFLPEDVAPLIANANDGSSEGTIHGKSPCLSMQLRPEAASGPTGAASGSSCET